MITPADIYSIPPERWICFSTKHSKIWIVFLIPPLSYNSVFRSLDESRVKGIHLRIAALSSGGSFLDGYDISIVSVAILVLTSEFSLSSGDETLLLGATIIGMVFGGVLGGYLTDRRGRKYIYLWDMVLFIVFAALTAVSTTFTELLVFRLLLGVAIGADYAISPTIIAEYSPVKQRGRLLTISGLSWFIGAAVSYGAGYFLSPLGAVSWRYMFLLGVIPAVIVLVLRASIPESPRWLVEQGRMEEAEKSMRRVDEKATIYEPVSGEKTSFRLLFSRKYIRATVYISVFWFILDAVTLVIALQGPNILETLGLSSTNASGTAAVIATIAIIGAVFTFLVVDRIGRKTVTAIGFAGMFITLLAASFVFSYSSSILLIVILFILFEISQEFGPGITNSIYPQELYPTNIRATAQGFGTTVSRIGAIVGIFMFSAVADPFGTAAGLLMLAVLSLLGLIATFVLGIETKGKSLEELTSGKK